MFPEQQNKPKYKNDETAVPPPTMTAYTTTTQRTKIFVLEFFSVNRFAAASVAVGKVPSLDHKLRNDPMERRSLVVQRLAAATDALFAGTLYMIAVIVDCFVLCGWYAREERK